MGIPSYALAILLFTIIIKLVLYPLTHKQMHSMKKMQDVQPLIKSVQEKYKKNPEKANKEVMEIYKKHNINPMAGCLPLLVQMPILIALFRALSTFQYSDIGASFLWIPHLKDADPFYIIPALVALTTYLQSKLTMPAGSSNTDATAASTQKTMLYIMPLFIGYISIRFPAGLGLYWIFFALLGTLQQMYINRQPAMKKEELGEQ